MEFGYHLPEEGKETLPAAPVELDPKVTIVLTASATSVLGQALLNLARETEKASNEKASKRSDSLDKAR